MQQCANDPNTDIIVTVDSDTSLLSTKTNHEHLSCTLNKKTCEYPFAGCVYFKPNVLKFLEKHSCFCNELEEHRLSGIIRRLVNNNFRVQYIDAHGLWTEVLKPMDVAKFVLTTKAQTLYTLRKQITKANIAKQVHFSVREWEENESSVINKILKNLNDKKLVVRSSSLQEDSFLKANAGKFESVLNVDPKADSLKKAIEGVVASYGSISNDDEVLVQPMLNDVKVSGVVFTRTLNYGAPYYVVNYDETDTAAVTSGSSTKDQTFYHWKYAPIPSNAPDFYKFDALDIEFAVTNNNELYIFQVRPLASQKLRELSDNNLQKHLDIAVERFSDLQAAHPDIKGTKTIFGVMPDWNPAEIVGTKPRTLAISLYQSLITNDIWAQQRSEFGYKDVRPYPLIVNFAGHPYVDVRASIHSFLPREIDDKTTEKLVNFFIHRLEQHPAWHDKLEFMVMPTCYTPDFDDRWHNLLIEDAQLLEEEYQKYRSSLLELTKSSFEKSKRFYQEMSEIEDKFNQIKASSLTPYDKIYTLIQTCKIGTLNFSHLARCGFIASSLLKSFVAKGIITETEKIFLTSKIQTITGQFFEKTREAILESDYRNECIETYGHLRPGTYDITSPTYRSNPDKYLFSNAINYEVSTPVLAPFDTEKLDHHLQELFNISLDDFKEFLQQAIAGREYSKFIFTKYISLILDLIQSIGQENGFSTNDMSNITISIFEDIRNGLLSPKDIKIILKTHIEYGKELHRVTQSIELPPLLTQNDDFYSFFIPKTLPNFIGDQCVETELVYLKNSIETEGSILKNRIVLIEKADPGFDWIFNYGIAGLITAYGGPNSHMAIRSAEFHLPASIGVGESTFNQLKYAKLVQLDCMGHRLNIIR